MNRRRKMIKVQLVTCFIKQAQRNKDIGVQFGTALFFATFPFLHFQQFLGP
jgi:hypothetical protein